MWGTISRYFKSLVTQKATPALPTNQTLSLKDAGNAAYVEENYERALEFYTKALETEPTNHILHSKSCLCLTNLNRFEEARTSILKCIELAPGYVEGHYLFAKVCFALGLIDDTIEALMVSELLDPTDHNIQTLFTDVLAVTEFTKDIAQIECSEFLEKHDMKALMRISHFIPYIIGVFANIPELQSFIKHILGNLVIMGELDTAVAQNPRLWIRNLVAFVHHFNKTQSYDDCYPLLQVAETLIASHLDKSQPSQLLRAYFHWNKGWFLCDTASKVDGLVSLYSANSIYQSYMETLSNRERFECYACLNSIAYTEMELGNFGMAEKLFSKIIVEYKEASPNFTAVVHSNVGVLYDCTWHVSDALIRIEKAAILYKEGGRLLDYLQAKLNIATICGDKEKSKAIVHEIIPMYEQHYPDHPDSMRARIQLAKILLREEKIQEAKDCLLSLSHMPATRDLQAYLYRELSMVFRHADDLDMALDSIQKAYALLKDDGNDVLSLCKVNIIYVAMLLLKGNLADCQPLLLEARMLHYNALASFYSINLQSSYLEDLYELTSVFIAYIEKVFKSLDNISITNENKCKENDFAYQICGFLISIKGIIGDSIKYNKSSPESQTIVSLIDFVNKECAAKAQKPEKGNKEYEGLEMARENLFNDLYEQNMPEDIDVASISEALPHDSAYVEYFMYDRYLDNRCRNDKWYIVLIILPQSKSVKILLIGRQSDVDVRQVVKTNPFMVEARNTSTDFGGMDDDDEGDVSLDKLSDILWSKVEPIVGSYKRIFLAPILDLVTLPFEILPQPNSSHALLCDKYYFNYVASGRDVLRIFENKSKACGRPIVIANPNYYLSGHNKTPSAGVPTTRQKYRPLPATEEEGSVCARLLQTTAYTGDAAVVSVVKKCQNPSVLHIASHATFNDGNPVIAFAGVNSYYDGLEVPYEAENGLLGGTDAALLSLQGSFVVLSACETGMCGSHWAEVAFGLRGKFFIAGAHCLVVSLCSVEDVVTARFMATMYKNLIEKGFTVNAAVREARQEIRSEGVPALVWSAFVVIGNGEAQVSI